MADATKNATLVTRAPNGGSVLGEEQRFFHDKFYAQQFVGLEPRQRLRVGGMPAKAAVYDDLGRVSCFKATTARSRSSFM